MLPKGRDMVLFVAGVLAPRAGPGHSRQGRNEEDDARGSPSFLPFMAPPLLLLIFP